jgi:flagellar motor switch protein FliG
VEEAQKKIVRTIKKLEEQGLVDLSRGGEATVG